MKIMTAKKSMEKNILINALVVYREQISRMRTITCALRDWQEPDYMIAKKLDHIDIMFRELKKDEYNIPVLNFNNKK